MAILKPVSPPTPPATQDDLLTWAAAMTTFLTDILGQAGIKLTSGTVTLDVSPATTTVVNDAAVTGTSRITLTPTHADSATMVRTGDVYISDKDRDAGTFTITHPADASVNLDFDYVLMHTQDL
jgi:hypothetical protein